jgi:hypothetical protein
MVAGIVRYERQTLSLSPTRTESLFGFGELVSIQEKSCSDSMLLSINHFRRDAMRISLMHYILCG